MNDITFDDMFKPAVTPSIALPAIEVIKQIQQIILADVIDL